MARVVVRRESGYRLSVTTGSAEAVVDRSVDQGGQGDGFRSVELLLAALGSCTIGTMLTYADENGIEVTDVQAELKAVESLATDTVTKARLTLYIAGPFDEDQRSQLEQAAAACKVHRSLHEGIETQLRVEVPAG
jgi:uncharacterized OsmC-like protein